MRLPDFIAIMDPEGTPDRTKIHLATPDEENPLDVSHRRPAATSQ